MYGVRKCSSFILLQVVDQYSQHHLLKRLSFFRCIYLARRFFITSATCQCPGTPIFWMGRKCPEYKKNLSLILSQPMNFKNVQIQSPLPMALFGELATMLDSQWPSNASQGINWWATLCSHVNMAPTGTGTTPCPGVKVCSSVNPGDSF